jgi:hypothetical protein
MAAFGQPQPERVQMPFSVGVEDSDQQRNPIVTPSTAQRGHVMRTTLTAVAAAATIAVATIAAPTAADARRGWWAPAIIGGLAAGAIIGSAYARPYYGGYGYYQPAPVYDGYAPAYYGGYSAPGPYYGCWRWRNGYRYRVC